jgi:hypothetical protein
MAPYYWPDTFRRGSETLAETPASLQGIPKAPQLEHGTALSHLICWWLVTCCMLQRRLTFTYLADSAIITLLCVSCWDSAAIQWSLTARARKEFFAREWVLSAICRQHADYDMRSFIDHGAEQ